MASQMQEKQVGDNTNTVVILASAMLEHANELINMGLTPQEVAAGYELAAEKALEILPTLIVEEAKDMKDIVQVKNFIRSAITSKQYDNEEVIADLVSKACENLPPLLFVVRDQLSPIRLAYSSYDVVHDALTNNSLLACALDQSPYKGPVTFPSDLRL